MEKLIGKQVKATGMAVMFGGEHGGRVVHVWRSSHDKLPLGAPKHLIFVPNSIFIEKDNGEISWLGADDYEVLTKDFIVGETYIVTQDTSLHMFPVGTQVVFKGRDMDGDAMFYPLGKFESEFRWVEDHDVKEVSNSFETEVSQ